MTIEVNDEVRHKRNSKFEEYGVGVVQEISNNNYTTVYKIKFPKKNPNGCYEVELQYLQLVISEETKKANKEKSIKKRITNDSTKKRLQRTEKRQERQNKAKEVVLNAEQKAFMDQLESRLKEKHGQAFIDRINYDARAYEVSWCILYFAYLFSSTCIPVVSVVVLLWYAIFWYILFLFYIPRSMVQSLSQAVSSMLVIMSPSREPLALSRLFSWVD